MVAIDKNYLSTKANYDWLEKRLEPNFRIVLDDKSKVVFGFNGIGKTSFSKCLQEDTSLNFRFLDYENVSQEIKGREITISPYVQRIRQLSKDIRDDSSSIDSLAYSKKQGFKKGDASKGPQFLRELNKNIKQGKPASIKKNQNDYSTFILDHKNVEPSILFEAANILRNVVDAQNEIDSFNEIKRREMLESAKKYIDANTVTCPVCDSHVDGLERIVEEKIERLASFKSDLIVLFEDEELQYDSSTIDEYIDLFRKIQSDKDLLNDYFLCGKDVARHNEIKAVSDRIATNESELSTLNETRKKKYLEIKRFKDQFKKDVSKYLKISDSAILFDDESFEITIKLDRDSKTYSTGERHILWFLVELYSFLGSDSSTLILDDPASSLDIINLYKIAFEIVDKSSKVDEKNIVVFTHSVDLTNSINSQYPGKIDIYYLEEYKGLLYCEEIEYRSNNSIPNVFDVERLSCYEPKIAQSLKKRDYEGHDCQEHKVYHYSPLLERSEVDCKLTNQSLVDLIDTFTDFNKTSFYEDSFNKILYLLSIRVWIEKELYCLIPSSEENRRAAFLGKETLNEKIKVLENTGTYGSNLLSVNSIDKHEMMAKKVMLNQNAHYYSQVMPFSFAVNLSLDDLKQEILDIKGVFGK